MDSRLKPAAYELFILQLNIKYSFMCTIPVARLNILIIPKITNKLPGIPMTPIPLTSLWFSVDKRKNLNHIKIHYVNKK